LKALTGYMAPAGNTGGGWQDEFNRINMIRNLPADKPKTNYTYNIGTWPS
jgi:hypothetical protein